MPELPEVETVCKGIEKHLKNNNFDKIIIRQNKLRWPITKNIDKKLKNNKILEVSRRAKYILIKCQTGTVIIHLGMSGKLCLVNKKEEIKKHDHVDFILKSGKILRYNDARRFGSIHYTENNPLEHKLLINLGIEPLDKNFNENFLYSVTRNKKTPIKLLLMNANIIVGVGNIYANEALFKSKILPTKPSCEVTLEQAKLLCKNIKVILKKAIKQGGTTLKDFVTADGKPGYFQQTLQVYGRGGQSCVECNATLTEKKLGQRTTVFCKQCQL